MKVRHKTIVFGLGAMGGALVKGWISSRMIPSSLITAVDVDAAKLKQTASKLKIKASLKPEESLKKAGLIILAVKPQQMKGLLSTLGPKFPAKALVVSIAAGISTSQIEKGLPQGNPVVRVMPNTPALLGVGMAAVAAGSRAKKPHVKTALELFSAVGRSIEVTEDQMDYVTAVSGSGPAYIFHMIEAMTEASVKGGLKPEVALELVKQTVLGAARMAIETGKSPEELRIQVTSPGGTTQAALTTLEQKGFKETINAAIESAAKRSAELRRSLE